MEHPSRILLAVCILLVAGIAFSGCSDNSGSGDSTTPASTTAKYSEGDIVQMASGSSTTGYLIIGYDSATDMYTRALIHKNSNGSWGYRSNADTSKIGRTEFESVFTVVASHVTVASIPTRAPTVAVTTIPTTKVTTGRTATTKTTTTTTTSTTGRPTIKTIDPEEGNQGESVDMTITGTNFEDGAKVTLERSGQSDIAATDIDVTSATRLTCTFSIPKSAGVGIWDVVVTNPDFKSGTLANYFMIHGTSSDDDEAEDPMVTSIEPEEGTQGDTVEMEITGKYFSTGATAYLERSGEDNIEGDVDFDSSTTLIFTFDIPSDADTGLWAVVVMNSDDSYDKLPSAFRIWAD